MNFLYAQDQKSEFSIEQYNDLAVIFIGKILNIEEVDNGFNSRIIFKPSKVFKGQPEGNIIVHTPSQKTHGCGIKAFMNEEWLIFSESDGDRLNTSYCIGSTKKITDNSTINELTVLSEQTGGYMEWKYSNGIVGGRGEIVAGKPNGEWTYYYQDGYLKSKGIYVSGNKEGEWTYYSSSKILYQMNNDLEVLTNIMDSLWLTPVAAKHLAETANYRLEPVMEDSTKNPVRRHGDLKKSESYKDGKLDGKVLTYHDNGQVEKEENYLKGRRHGVYITYYANGQKSREGGYSQGIPKGKWVDYNRNGSVRHEAMDAIPAYRATKDGMVPITEKKSSGATSMN
ncbi:MAG: hypothetical protein KDD36_00580 [Flavobacteriales bacterium]|nr:hypothetical protein [Flavobacteriales bacterium]